MRYLIETLWNQRKRYESIIEKGKLYEEACGKVKGTDYLGIFNPLNEPWQWAYFIEVEGLEDWETIYDEIAAMTEDRIDNVTQSTTRFYGLVNYNPKPKGQPPLRLVNVELDVWEGVNVGIQEYHDIHVKIFDGKDDVWYMGQYSPANEDYHWAHLYWFDSWELMNEMSIASFRTTGRPERLKTLCTRNYRRYERAPT